MPSKTKTNRLISAFQAFEEKRYSLSDYGAADTEPREVAYAAIARYLTVGIRATPGGTNGWQLYSDTPGAGRAARSLTTALRKVFNAIDKASQPEIVEFRAYADI